MSERKTAIKSIRSYCVTVCCAGDVESVRNCPDGVPHGDQAACALWVYRMGKNDAISQEVREAQRQRAIARGFGAKSPPTINAVKGMSP